ncbi:hypothetical protein [Leifsonia aquatica]|uniref:hypothetical protein n=1 Tax=Leifsonia aquatica TaxID=144185 RepID=UPI0028AEA63A|nr:hypothetical protein [Leifsonia aquatica]
MELLDAEQVKLLTLVRLTPGMAVTRLSRLLQVTPRATRLQIEELESRGLLERRNHPDHPDANELHVTDAGVSALATAS